MTSRAPNENLGALAHTIIATPRWSLRIQFGCVIHSTRDVPLNVRAKDS